VIALAVLLLAVLPAWAGPGVAESNVIPDRLIRSKGHVHYNYDVHAVEVEMEGERVIMYRYRWIRMAPPIKKDAVDKEVGDAKSLDSKDAVSLEGKAPLCTETTVPDWAVSPDTVEKLEIDVSK